MAVTPEEMLRGSAELRASCSKDEWRELIRYLLERMKEWLGYEVTTKPVESATAHEDGFCIEITHAAPAVDAPIYWRGVLGASTIDGELRITTGMFVYTASGERLVTRSGKEYVDYVYVHDEAGGRWELFGWFEDEYGEFGMF